MANKPHLAISTEPIQPRVDQEVVCGEILPTVKLVDIYFMESNRRVDLAVFDRELRRLCPKCRKWLALRLGASTEGPITEYLYVFQRGDGKEELESV